MNNKDLQLYFLKDEYYERFPDKYLEKNKASLSPGTGRRPFFLAFTDTKHPEIHWLVPISSEYDKYPKIYNHKIAKRGYCETIILGKPIEIKGAILIQNMCPATKRYMVEYLDRNNNPVRINKDLADKTKRYARSVLAQMKNGNRVVFPDVMKIYNELAKNLELEKQHSKQTDPQIRQKKPLDLNALKKEAEGRNRSRNTLPGKSTRSKDDPGR